MQPHPTTQTSTIERHASAPDMATGGGLVEDKIKRRPKHAKMYLVLALLVAAAFTTACSPVVRSAGVTRSANPVSNPAYAGQCTWAVEELWHQATGSYLAEAGDAWEWAANAASFGWTVTSTPSNRAIVVFPRGVAGAHTDTGHVAWVTGVSQRADGIYVDVMEMNWDQGPYQWDIRTLKSVPGLSYVLAP